MKVYFIGAGPGAPDLITLRGVNILKNVPMVMYAGSLVSVEILEHCAEGTEIIDTSQLNLEEQESCYLQAKEKHWDVARVHSGDPSIYGAIAEQIRRLNQLEIPFEIVPGVSSFAASAAALNAELTKPKMSQTIILTRTSGRASPVPEKEALSELAAHQATLCIFLSGPHLPQIVKDLRQHYPDNTPIVLVYKATWPQEKIHRSTLENLLDEIKVKDWALSTMILVGEVLSEDLLEESQLYSSQYTHRFRTAKKTK
ncbi:MAG: precorrin-4 C(11)-methyltransferase [SAR324 cluster bacterium]|nr:precorrin-4 C(11)-methyltransferase [SAR324 cluster bacterium]